MATRLIAKIDALPLLFLAVILLACFVLINPPFGHWTVRAIVLPVAVHPGAHAPSADDLRVRIEAARSPSGSFVPGRVTIGREKTSWEEAERLLATTSKSRVVMLEMDAKLSMQPLRQMIGILARTGHERIFLVTLPDPRSRRG